MQYIEMHNLAAPILQIQIQIFEWNVATFHIGAEIN